MDGISSLGMSRMKSRLSDSVFLRPSLVRCSSKMEILILLMSFSILKSPYGHVDDLIFTGRGSLK